MISRMPMRMWIGTLTSSRASGIQTSGLRIGRDHRRAVGAGEASRPARRGRRGTAMLSAPVRRCVLEVARRGLRRCRSGSSGRDGALVDVAGHLNHTKSAQARSVRRIEPTRLAADQPLALGVIEAVAAVPDEMADAAEHVVEQRPGVAEEDQLPEPEAEEGLHQGVGVAADRGGERARRRGGACRHSSRRPVMRWTIDIVIVRVKR